MRILVITLLAWIARRIIWKYKPKIIGITGTVGKTSAKEAIATVLSSAFSVRKSFENYNNELGVPLAIIGSESGHRSIVRWIKIFMKGFSLLFIRDVSYPQILVLEMGIDHPGDMDYLLSLVSVDVPVITAIDKETPVHLEFFRDAEQLIREKMKLVLSLHREQLAVIPFDMPIPSGVKSKIRSRLMTFGSDPSASVRAVNVIVSKKMSGISFKLMHKGSTVPIVLPQVLGVHQVNAGLVAASVGLELGMNLVQISDALQHFRPPAGRMRLIPGIKRTLLIDDSYNAAAMAMRSALEGVCGLEVSGRKVGCLGSMLQLGVKSRRVHRDIGKLAAEVFDILVTVGEEASFIGQGALKAGLSPDRVFHFDNASEAGRFLQDRVQSGDVILVKGSQAMRMERVVKELMAEPLRASELLVRQQNFWLERE